MDKVRPESQSEHTPVTAARGGGLRAGRELGRDSAGRGSRLARARQWAAKMVNGAIFSFEIGRFAKTTP
jgi:hypothetical protein